APPGRPAAAVAVARIRSASLRAGTTTAMSPVRDPPDMGPILGQPDGGYGPVLLGHTPRIGALHQREDRFKPRDLKNLAYCGLGSRDLQIAATLAGAAQTG